MLAETEIEDLMNFIKEELTIFIKMPKDVSTNKLRDNIVKMSGVAKHILTILSSQIADTHNINDMYISIVWQFATNLSVATADFLATIDNFTAAEQDFTDTLGTYMPESIAKLEGDAIKLETMLDGLFVPVKERNRKRSRMT
jgi:hypothetical protein